MITKTVLNNGYYLWSCLLSHFSSLLVKIHAECHSYFTHGRSLPRQHPISQEKPGTHRQPQCVTDDGVPGNSFQVSRASFLNKHEDWTFFLRQLLCVVTKIRLFPFASFPIRGSFLLSLRNVENKSCSSYCRHLWQKLASPPWTQAFSSVCLIFSNAHFLFLQAQLIHLILSAVLLIVLSSEMLL